jgi:hypothetical protein
LPGSALSCEALQNRGMEAAGIEPAAKSSGNRWVTDQSGAETGAQGTSVDPELTEVVDAWLRVPASIKAGILAMIRAAK